MKLEDKLLDRVDVLADITSLEAKTIVGISK